ncbi:MAG: hypothetical protein KGH64_02665 [Candidatus Micrarchaeota archaeon]|nr:hypothetical protein [Candidatus Micrarchaeota archaeon]MDE1834215.1 hypothetical protein [Candidatus Micrarchaeota archaeon]MDE1859743.1 hypothetical protein [Candidatus Micrarchaeota archaeon]
MAKKNASASLIISVFSLLFVILFVFTLSFGYLKTTMNRGTTTILSKTTAPSSTVARANQSDLAVNFTQEINNSIKSGFSVNLTVFLPNAQSACTLQLISPCNNNVASQFICINPIYKQALGAQYQQLYPPGHACPMYLVAGNISCAIQYSHCVVLDKKQDG